MESDHPPLDAYEEYIARKRELEADPEYQAYLARWYANRGIPFEPLVEAAPPDTAKTPQPPDRLRHTMASALPPGARQDRPPKTLDKVVIDFAAVVAAVGVAIAAVVFTFGLILIPAAIWGLWHLFVTRPRNERLRRELTAPDGTVATSKDERGWWVVRNGRWWVCDEGGAWTPQRIEGAPDGYGEHGNVVWNVEARFANKITALIEEDGIYRVVSTSANTVGDPIWAVNNRVTLHLARR